LGQPDDRDVSRAAFQIGEEPFRDAALVGERAPGEAALLAQPAHRRSDRAQKPLRPVRHWCTIMQLIVVHKKNTHYTACTAAPDALLCRAWTHPPPPRRCRSRPIPAATGIGP